MAKLERMIIGDQEVQRILEACDGAGGQYSAARDRALIAVQYRCGLRPGEALGLWRDELREIDGKLAVRVNRPKGYQTGRAKPRELDLDEKAEALMKAWIDRRGEGHGPLFCNRAGDTMSIQYWGRRLKTLARRAGLERRAHPHGLRHSFAHWYCRKYGILMLQRAMGHSKIETTIIYCSELGLDDEIRRSTGTGAW